MKKMIYSSVFTIIVNILYLILNGVIGFVFLLGSGLSKSFNGSADMLFINSVIILIAISMAFNFILIIYSIVLLVSIRKKNLGKRLNISTMIYLIIYVISIIINISIILSIISSNFTYINMFLSLIEVALILIFYIGRRKLMKLASEYV